MLEERGTAKQIAYFLPKGKEFIQLAREKKAPPNERRGTEG
jgi:hypothetical protein